MSTQAVALTDEELVAAVVGRRPGAWAELSRRYERVMLGCIRNTLRRYHAFAVPEDVEDILGTVLLQLVRDDHKKLRTFDPTRGYKLSSWIGLIATNATLDSLRRRGPAQVSIDAYAANPLPVVDPAESPSDTLERRQKWDALAAAVRELPAADQEFLRLYYEEELEPEDLARRLGIALNTVYSRKNKLREKLRRLVDREGS